MDTITLPFMAFLENARAKLAAIPAALAVVATGTAIATGSTIYYFRKGWILAYGDAESHLNIAKRVIDSLTPSLAQLGGIWLPLPHLLLVPFVASDFLWRTGLAGSIVSGICYVVSALFLYKLVLLVTNHRGAALVGSAVFILNPNILYLQSTPMTEPVLIVFFVLSSYYFVRFLYQPDRVMNLVSAAFFGFCASLSRYDGWGLVLMEAGIVFLMYLPHRLSSRRLWSMLEGKLILFSTLAFLGIALWFLWGWLILGDPLYFSHSQYSAKSQQNSWLARGELPAYQHIGTAIHYYAVTAEANIGTILSWTALAGLLLFLLDRRVRHRFFIVLLLAVPFIFNVATLYLGQSVIFIPSLTPASWGWQIFNVRYGVMMVPCAAFFAGYLFYWFLGMMKDMRSPLRIILPCGALAVILLVTAQTTVFASGGAPVITLEDGTEGLSSAIAKPTEIQGWFDSHYDGGLVLLDDYSRPISIVRSPVPMQDIIYVGNKPYWDDSLTEPEKYATWIIIEQNDTLWQDIWENPVTQARLYTYFNKEYQSDNFIIFKRINNATTTAQLPPPPPPAQAK